MRTGMSESTIFHGKVGKDIVDGDSARKSDGSYGTISSVKKFLSEKPLLYIEHKGHDGKTFMLPKTQILVLSNDHLVFKPIQMLTPFDKIAQPLGGKKPQTPFDVVVHDIVNINQADNYPIESISFMVDNEPYVYVNSMLVNM